MIAGVASHHMFERVILGFAGITLAVYGAVFFFVPHVLGDIVGLQFTSPNAPVEIRSFYGGLEFGIAAFLLTCAWRPALVPAGILLCALAFSCAGAARLIGVAQYGSDGPSQPLVGAIELALAIVCTLFTIRRREAMKRNT
jgi:uncharacterized protein DUF4345